MDGNPRLAVHVQEADFDVAELQSRLLSGEAVEGAVASFTGYMRADDGLESMELEHYPGMTEKSIREIVRQAAQEWPILAACVVHRVGTLRPGDRIVWVGVSSSHRGAAFSACEFIMDYLKTRAPFWKRERGPEGARWVEARVSDTERAGRWEPGTS